MRLFVLILLFCGVLLHVAGSFSLQLGDADVVAHYGMLAADLIALVGLMLGYRWGYVFSLVLFVYAVSSQTYWTVEAIVKKYDMAAPQAAVALLCGVALYFLVRYKEKFILRVRTRVDGGGDAAVETSVGTGVNPQPELAESF